MSNVAVVVVGDFGRSPRMQYHTLSLASSGHKVAVVASKGSKPIEELQHHPNVTYHLIRDLKFHAWPRLFRYSLKALYQTIMLVWMLMIRIPRPSAILVQNPPSVPTLPCVWLTCKLRGAKFILDWHNYGCSILAMSVRRGNFIVKLYQWIEFYFGKKADCGFCVSDAMKIDLVDKGMTNITVLHDKPSNHFQAVDWNDKKKLAEIHEFLVRLSVTKGMQMLADSDDETILTSRVNNDIMLKPSNERPFLLLSSTSWTEDEDFGLLLAALGKYDKASTETTPRIVCIVTGKGPQKEFYLEKISHLEWNKIQIVTPWLEIEDYPKLVSICDMGVCLHKSSSSLDLPMKIVDMFGCCVPVLAWKYKCISELVIPEQTGLLFESSDQLCRHLLKMCDPKNRKTLNDWRNNIKDWQSVRWNDNWSKSALPLFT